MSDPTSDLAGKAPKALSDIDFAHTSEANRHRQEKAKALARHLYDNLVDADEAACYDDATHRRTERAAGVRRCREETWALVVDMLRRRATYDAAHAPEADETDGHNEATTGDTPPPECEDGETTGDSHSDGGDPCEHYSDGSVCGASPTRTYLPGDRCAMHTPSALAGRPESVPDPRRSLNGLREAAGLPLAPLPPQSASTVIDMQAVASGKRRSSPQAYRAARQHQERGRRRAAG